MPKFKIGDTIHHIHSQIYQNAKIVDMDDTKYYTTGILQDRAEFLFAFIDAHFELSDPIKAYVQRKLKEIRGT